MEEPSVEYDQGFIDGVKEGKRQLQAELKKPEAGKFTEGAMAIIRMGEKSYEAMKVYKGQTTDGDRLLWNACSKLKIALTMLDSQAEELDVKQRHLNRTIDHNDNYRKALTQLQAELDQLKELFETRTVPINTPPIVCLCGSTRFMDAFFQAGWKFTLEGRIVLSVGVCKHAEHHGGEALGQNVADGLDELHLRKIDLADEVFVLNVDGYIGESTRKEIEYAEAHNKPIRYLETPPKE